MKYIEIGATYEVLVPEGWEDAYETSHIGTTAYKQFWDGRLFIVDGFSGKDYVNGSSPGREGRCTVYIDWLNKLVKHCPQVEYYIASQGQKKDFEIEGETYISPFTGQIE